MFIYQKIEGKPDDITLKKIAEFYESIFEEVDKGKFQRRINEADDLLTILALEKGKIVGFKIGYRLSPKIFYSWIGGVDKNYRKNGIAADLMERQRLWCVKNAYEKIQTKTRNTFKGMLILNIKSGFNIVEVYKDSQDELKIVLEKNLPEV